MRRPVARLAVPILVAAALLAAALAGHGASLLDLSRASHHAVLAWTERNPSASAVAFVIAMALGKVTPVPGGIAMMLIGSYLFGTVLGGLLAATGAALSAGLVAALGRWLVLPVVERRWGGRLAPLAATVAADGFSYLLALRLLPVVPAWLVNLVPLVVPIPIATVLAATFVGLLPISFVVASLGSGLARLSAADAPGVEVLLRPGVLLPLLGLALLALAPVARRRFRGWRGGPVRPG